MIELQQVHYIYQSKFQAVHALKGVSYSFSPGKIHSIVGRSGSGKSTLLKLMAGLFLPSNGTILCNGKSTADWDLAEYRRSEVSVIYQDYRLFPLLTVAENIMFPMEMRGISACEAYSRALDALSQVSLSQQVADRYPAMLSGGEQQRVSIARAFCSDNRILLADEPTGNLDTENSIAIFKLLASLAHDKGYCVVLVTHENDLASKTDDILELCDGKIKGHL